MVEIGGVCYGQREVKKFWDDVISETERELWPIVSGRGGDRLELSRVALAEVERRYMTGKTGQRKDGSELT
jgi:hypothetical protein